MRTEEEVKLKIALYKAYAAKERRILAETSVLTDAMDAWTNAQFWERLATHAAWLLATEPSQPEGMERSK